MITVLAVMFVLLQWRLWVGDGGVQEVQRHQSEINRLSQQLEEQRDINSALRAEVRDLQNGLGEIEERARSELGMIGDDNSRSDNLARITSEERDKPAQTTNPQ